MRTIIKMVASAAAAIALTACTTTEQVAVEEPSDFNLSCYEIEGEIAQLNSRMDSLFFWPAEDGEMNGAEVERRLAPLVDLYEKKGCVASPPLTFEDAFRVEAELCFGLNCRVSVNRTEDAPGPACLQVRGHSQSMRVVSRAAQASHLFRWIWRQPRAAPAQGLLLSHRPEPAAVSALFK